MSRYVEFDLPDGSTVIIESDEDESGVVFGQAVENARKSAMVIMDKVRELGPDEVEVTFGLKASGELGNLVVAKAGVEASYSIKLKWKKE